MPRIAVAGFQHETNTFMAVPAGLDAFEMADSWPGMLHGEAVIAGTAGINLPIAGFIEAAAAVGGVEILPLLWCAAEPSGRVTDAAFETITGMIVARALAARPLDALYLDLHGAMVTESAEDGEGLLLSRLRGALGPDLPIVVSLDLHANVSDVMVAEADRIAIFRTYPHLDMAETGARCLPMILDHLAGRRPAKAFRRVPFLIPLQAQFTGAAPCRDLYAGLSRLPPGITGEIALGFTAADTPDTGATVLAYAPEPEAAEDAADRLLAAITAAEGTFDTRMLSPEEGVRTAMAAPRGPVVLADVQDNPGAGAPSDSTGILHALVAAGAESAVLALLADPEIAAAAHAAGPSAVIDGALGGKSGLPDQHPFEGRFTVERLTDGLCVFTGEMYRGATAHLGLTAVLRVVGTDVRVIVSTQRSQALDRGIFAHAGIDPAACRILVLKSTVHYRADFDPIAAATYSVAAPGGFDCDLTALAYHRLTPGIRLGPRGPAFAAQGACP